MSPRNSSTSDLALKATIGMLLIVLAVVIVRGMRPPLTDAGDKAPSFSITTDSGRKITPTDFGGRVLILNFWASWCPPCVEEEPSMDELQRQLASSGVVVLGVSVDRNEKAYAAFLHRFHPSFQTARDPEENISYRYGTVKIPETYIIDHTGKVVQKVISSRNWMDPELVQYLKTL